MFALIITRIVDVSRRFAWPVLAAALALTLACAAYSATHFKINTDINQLLSGDLPWRQQEKALEQAFPHHVDNLVIVIDGDTADAAENAAIRLAGKLKAMPQLFTFVQRPDALPFFRKNGFLFLSKPELSETLDQLAQAQPLMGMLSSDPSLRGFAGMLSLMAQGIQAGQVDAARLERPFNQISATFEAALKEQNKSLDLQSMTGETQANPRELRKYILTKPVLNYSELESGKAARDEVRRLTQELELNAAHGVRVRMTGSVALNDEEFMSVAGGTGTATLLSGVLVFALLLLAMRSLRIVLPILLTLCCGLFVTLAFALAVFHSLNMMSVAFAVMFIGIAVDFGIQFGIRYRDQHHNEPDHKEAMRRTASVIAVPLTMATASTALGFLAFIPTDYRGVSELGAIAGVGMLVAFFLNITLLPALLSLFKPAAESEAIGYRWAAPIDALIVQRRKIIIGVAALLALAGLGLATQLPFDFDPLNLKDPKMESVATMFDVMSDPDSGAYAAEVLRPTLSDATALAEQTDRLPEVDHAMTLASFIPEDQQAKLAMIADTRALLGPTLSLPQLPPPAPEENFDALQKLAVNLHAVGKDHASAERLATALDQTVALRDTTVMTRLDANLISAMQNQIARIKDLLSAETVTIDTMPEELRRDWVSADNRYRVQIHPKGNARDHATLIRFTDAIRRIAPDAGGTPVSIRESGRTVTNAFVLAGVYALVAIAFLSCLILKSVRATLFMLSPLVLAGILTLATIVVIGLPLNFANIIALPLLLSLGVSYGIYFVTYLRSGNANPLQSSMARAVLFSAATVLVAFGTLAISTHPGTSGMGKLLTLSLVYSVLSTFIVLPALLGSHKPDKS